jgi:methionine sulfoxide reductase heme-binding subunit
LLPVLTLGWRGTHGDLGANPVEFVTHSTGDWTLRFLLITLAVTPARRVIAMPSLIRFRRMFGLFAFFYGCLHLLTYIWFDKFFDIEDVLKDVGKRRFITIGFASLLLMIPLAVTSTAAWIRRLGGKRWQLLHRLVYLIASGGVIHYYWLVKSDIRLPVLYGAILIVLLAFRLFVFVAKRRVKHGRMMPQVLVGRG